MNERRLVKLEQQLARCLPALQITVRLSGILERVNVVDLDLYLLGDDKVKELRGVSLKVGPFSDIAIDDGPHELDVFGTKLQDVDRGDGSRLVNFIC